MRGERTHQGEPSRTAAPESTVARSPCGPLRVYIDMLECERNVLRRSEQVIVIVVTPDGDEQDGNCMSQMSFSDAEYAGKRKKTPR